VYFVEKYCVYKTVCNIFMYFMHVILNSCVDLKKKKKKLF